MASGFEKVLAENVKDLSSADAAFSAAMMAMGSYMSMHNYGMEDRDKYIKDDVYHILNAFLIASDGVKKNVWERSHKNADMFR